MYTLDYIRVRKSRVLSKRLALVVSGRGKKTVCDPGFSIRAAAVTYYNWVVVEFL